MNRTKLGIRTTIVVLIVSLVQGTLNIVRTKYILLSFGSDINAIVQIAIQMGAYLSLVESGMTAAYQFELYMPSLNRDIKKISALYLGLKHNMAIIGIKMFIIGNISAAVYCHFVLEKMVGFFSSFTILFIMCIRIVIPYYFAIPEKVLIVVHEKGYVTNIIQGLRDCAALILEILLCKYTKLPLYIILSTYILIVLLVKPLYVVYIKKYLNINIIQKEKIDENPKRLTKDILLHQISGLITSNTDTIVLSILDTLKSVTIYSNFSTLINYPITLFNSLINSMKASVIIKIQYNEADSQDIYNKMIILASVVMCIVSTIFMMEGNSFIILWVGSEYQISKVCLSMFAFVLYMQIVLTVLIIAIDAKGLYKETKCFAVVQAVINLSCTIILVPRYGIEGALFATAISMILIKLIAYNIIICRLVFKKKNRMVGVILLGYIVSLMVYIIGDRIGLVQIFDSWLDLIVSTCINFIVSSLLIIVFFTAFVVEFRALCKYLYFKIKNLDVS